MDVETGAPPLLPAGSWELGEKPVWRGRLHQIAFFVTLPAGFFLLASAHSTAARIAVAVYWATLAGQFGASASYHRLARTQRAVKWLRRIDHSMIFCLIAGTYTPICILVLPRAWGIPMLVAAWVTALAGVIMKLIRVGTNEGATGSWLYGVLGGAAVIVLPQLLAELGWIRAILLASGGLFYTVGAIVLGKRRPNPRPMVFGYHEVWHAFTLAAGACHFALIALVLS
jgi:hemolysin III